MHRRPPLELNLSHHEPSVIFIPPSSLSGFTSPDPPSIHPPSLHFFTSSTPGLLPSLHPLHSTPAITSSRLPYLTLPHCALFPIYLYYSLSAFSIVHFFRSCFISIPPYLPLFLSLPFLQIQAFFHSPVLSPRLPNLTQPPFSHPPPLLEPTYTTPRAFYLHYS